MSEQEFESYLRLMGRLLNLSTAQRERIAGELRDHLEERLSELIDQGIARDAAIMQALDEFGDAAGLANDLKQAARARQRRLIMRTGIGSVGIAAAIVITTALMPWHGGSNNAAGPGGANADTPVKPTQPAAAAAIADPNTPMPGPAAAAVERPSHIDNGADTADAKVLAKLNDKTDFAFDNNRLGDTIEFLRGQTGLNIDVNWTALSAAGVDQDKQITLKLKGVSFAKALRLVLDHLTPDGGVQYVVQDGMVLISTAPELSRHTTIHIYNVRNLIGVASSSPQAPRPGAIGAPGGPAAPFAPGVAVVPDAAVGDTGSPIDRANQLVNLIESLIDNGGWTANGGNVGQIYVFDGLLIIRHTASVHQQIRELLQALGEASAADRKPEPDHRSGRAEPTAPSQDAIATLLNQFIKTRELGRLFIPQSMATQP